MIGIPQPGSHPGPKAAARSHRPTNYEPSSFTHRANFPPGQPRKANNLMIYYNEKIAKNEFFADSTNTTTPRSGEGNPLTV